jgi:acyl-coenzyme A thioesterase PaaI-like protein
MSFPVPASTDPVADAATHIAALADAIGARLTARSTAYWAGTVTLDSGGHFLVPGLVGVLASMAGALVTDDGPAAHLFRVVATGPPGTATIRVHTNTGASMSGGSVAVAVIAWGTPA